MKTVEQLEARVNELTEKLEDINRRFDKFLRLDEKWSNNVSHKLVELDTKADVCLSITTALAAHLRVPKEDYEQVCERATKAVLEGAGSVMRAFSPGTVDQDLDGMPEEVKDALKEIIADIESGRAKKEVKH